MAKLNTPKQLAAKIKTLKKDVALLKRAKLAETKALRAIKKATGALKAKRGHKKKTAKKTTLRLTQKN